MVQFQLALLNIIISLALIISGIYFNKKALWLVIAGGIILMITGIFLLGDPIAFKSGVNITNNITGDNNITTSQETIIYQEQDNSLNYVLSFTLLILGLAAIWLATISLYNLQFDIDDND